MHVYRAIPLVARLLCGIVAVGCAAGEVQYPGTADVSRGAAPLVRFRPTGSTEPDPRILRARPGTEVTFLNASRGQAYVRFDDPVGDLCAPPVGFEPATGGRGMVSGYLPPFAEARLCFATPGRYEYVVSRIEPPGPVPFRRGDEPPESPVLHGTIVIE